MARVTTEAAAAARYAEWKRRRMEIRRFWLAGRRRGWLCALAATAALVVLSGCDQYPSGIQPPRARNADDDDASKIVYYCSDGFALMVTDSRSAPRLVCVFQGPRFSR